VALTPFPNQGGLEHVLGAGATWAHCNGNIYWVTNEKRGSGDAQDMVIYRSNGASAPVEVKRYVGGVDSLSQFTMGSVVVDKTGTLFVATSTTLPGSTTGTGFEAVYEIIPGFDDACPEVEPCTPCQDGATGPAGADGAPGSIGPQGLQGPMGNVGPKGPRGLQGPACECCENCTSSQP
jgi:hypothetical protein